MNIISSQAQGDTEGEQSPKETQFFMAVWNQDGHETTIQIRVTDNGSIPLVAVDPEGLAVLRRFAQAVANKYDENVNIICFTGRQLYESYSPSATGD